jgi:3-hydroxyisobutyrate dehydrogenase-like beta-hydroxyacid dehydrogenase
VPIRRVAFLGTGLMGSPMVLRLLQAGIAVRVWNRSAEKLRPLVAAGATIAQSPAEAVQGAEAVCLCLASVDAAESILFGPRGVTGGTPPPTLIVDFSTIGPRHTANFAARLAQQCWADWVDAPVSGGVPGAAEGKLVIFCGGEYSHIQRLGAVFGAISQRVTHAGMVGAGQTMKLCNQLIVSCNLVAIAEAIALARAGGIDARLLPQALAGGFADSIPLQVFGGRMASGITTPTLGAIALMIKDAGAIGELALAKRLRLPVAAATWDVYQKALAQGLAGEDLSALMGLYEN